VSRTKIVVLAVAAAVELAALFYMLSDPDVFKPAGVPRQDELIPS
jgi:hypothetical protein